MRLLKNKRFVSRLVKAAVLTGMDYLPIILKKGQPFLEALSIVVIQEGCLPAGEGLRPPG